MFSLPHLSHHLHTPPVFSATCVTPCTHITCFLYYMSLSDSLIIYNHHLFSLSQSSHHLHSHHCFRPYLPDTSHHIHTPPILFVTGVSPDTHIICLFSTNVSNHLHTQLVLFAHTLSRPSVCSLVVLSTYPFIYSFIYSFLFKSSDFSLSASRFFLPFSIISCLHFYFLHSNLRIH